MDAAVVSRSREYGGGEGATLCRVRARPRLGGGSPARRRLLAGGISMSGPKRCVPCKKSRQPIVDLSGMPRLRLRDYIPMENKAMIVGRCIQVWMHRRSSRGILFVEAVFPFLSSRAASIGRDSIVGCSIVLAIRVGREVHARRICRAQQPARLSTATLSAHALSSRRS